MPPVPNPLRHRDTTSTPYGDGGPPDEHRRPWVIPVIVGGIIVTTALVVSVFVVYKKRNEYRKAREKEPSLTRAEFARRRTMSEADRLEEEEKQRIIMIRKSLASRSWNSTDSAASSRRVSRNSDFTEPAQHEQPDQPSQNPSKTVDEDDDDEEPKPLKEDWKAWEARVQPSLDRHPAADYSPLLRTPNTPPLRPQDSSRETP
jgi:hypothetical protein